MKQVLEITQNACLYSHVNITGCSVGHALEQVEVVYIDYYLIGGYGPEMCKLYQF